MKSLLDLRIFMILFNLINTINLLQNIEVPENALLTTPEIIMKFGYPVEIHTVITDDGYILTLHRIPHNTKSNSNDKPAVLLLHGFTSNSAEAVVAGPGNSLALFLSDSGYDVWLGNTRGNRYSRQHISLNRNNPEYWNFSWFEIGYYDVPAMIDYILQITKQEKIFYIGHSRGTTVSYIMCSERPEYNDKLKALISLAPVVYISQIRNQYFQFIAKNYKLVFKYLDSLRIYQLDAGPRAFVRIGQIFCADNSATQPLCQLVFFTFVGFDYKYFNSSIIPTMLGHFPDAAAVKEICNFAQLINAGIFRKYDYGYRNNLLVYNSTVPPAYNLTKITAPVALFYSANDYLSPVSGTEQIHRELGNPIDKLLLPKSLNHLAYHFGVNMREVYFEKILDIFKRY